MTNKQQVEFYLKKVIDNIDNELDNSPKILKEVLQYLKIAKGKHVRAKCVLATANALGDIDDNIISIATSIEIIHMATLVHDDVIDDAKMRRGVESIQSKYGQKMAVIVGDYLFTKAFKILSIISETVLENATQALHLMAVGEALQLQNYNNYDISINEYFKIIGCKTSALFSISFYATASYLKADESTCKRLSFAGFHLGQLFQLTDDCLDYKENNNHLKKELFKDLAEGVMTYPLIHTFKVNKDLKNKLKNGYSYEDMDFIIKEVVLAGGVSATAKLSKKQYNKAKKKIMLALPHNNEILIEILDTVYNRVNC